MKKLYNLKSREQLLQELKTKNLTYQTLSFYKYFVINHLPDFRNELYAKLDELDVLGRIYISYEGINGQISVPEIHLDRLREILYSYPEMDQMRLNFAIEELEFSFLKLKIKTRNKIVADGLKDKEIDLQHIGVHLNAEDFNAITDREDTIVVDMRNHYESEVGHFKDAILPPAETFRESLRMVKDILKPERDKNIVMYCTGGIRCEKASSFLKAKGYKKVYQLNGGIIEYARQVEDQGLENKFLGKNFVFDERLGERISEDVIAQCHQCGEDCDTHINCANDACHLLFIQCEKCAQKYNHCCSQKCADFLELPEVEQLEKRKTEIFNGSKFGKGRYKAHKNTSPLG